MVKVEVHWDRYTNKVCTAMNTTGLLLASTGLNGYSNIMALGWGLIGRLCGKPYFLVAVAKTRYTHKLINETGDFTVNIPKQNMKDIVTYCGTISGRDLDKYKECNLTSLPGKKVKSHIVEECVVHYECKATLHADPMPIQMKSQLSERAFKQIKYHTVFFGEILTVYADEDFESPDKIDDL